MSLECPIVTARRSSPSSSKMSSSGVPSASMARVWQENLVDCYVSDEEDPVAFEQQPVRTFATTMQKYFQKAGWGSY